MATTAEKAASCCAPAPPSKAVRRDASEAGVPEWRGGEKRVASPGVSTLVHPVEDVVESSAKATAAAVKGVQMPTRVQTSHPLDPLSAAEISVAVATVRASGATPEVRDSMRFVEVVLQEPDKSIVALADAYFFPPFQPSLLPKTKGGPVIPTKLPPRRARLVVYNKRSNETSIWIVELSEVHAATRGGHHRGKVISSEVVPDVQPPMDAMEYAECEALVKDYPPFIEAMKKRGIEDMDLVMVDPWCIGYHGENDAPSRRLAKPLIFCRTESDCPMENGYARPVEGIYVLVDLQNMVIIEFEDRKFVPLPPADPLRNYTSGATRGGVDRSDVKPLHINQPEGPSFRINGHYVEWQKWNFRIGFTPREGLVIHSVAYVDGSRGRRPVAHRLSFVEMVVPYGDPNEPHYRKNAFDAGEDGLGKNAHSLKRGCDCLGYIRYFDAHFTNFTGGVETIENCVCLHEEDFGILWKHQDWRTGLAEVRRSRRLTVSFICTVANYEYGFYWHFYQDIRTGNVIGHGYEQGGLYRLNQTPFAGITSPPTGQVSSLLWHLRLGHLPLQKLRLVLPYSFSHTPIQCEACQLGKHHRSSFPNSQGRSSNSKFELFHVDVWGPSRVPDHQGHRYYIVFVDDFSRASWVFLMKNKSEAGNIIIQFLNEIQNVFSTTIKILRSDNALELCTNNLANYYSSKGIVHQTSCAHTSQQNGVAERKHRHLLDVTRSLLIQSHVPYSYWGDAVLTACYLINRMPSSVLNEQVPFSLIYPDKDLFTLTARVFGSVAFVHQLSPGSDKLSPRAVKCVFVGYSRTQKGYKCFDPLRRRYMISADVTFFESIMYFSDSGNMQPPSIPPDIVFMTPPPSQPPQTSQPSPPPPPPPSIVPPLPFHYTRRPNQAHGPDQSTSSPMVCNENINVDGSDDISQQDTLQEHGDATADLNVPIALRKPKRSCVQYPVSAVVSFERLSGPFRTFALALSATAIPRNHHDAMQDARWRLAMEEEMEALQSRGTWSLVPIPQDVSPVSCKWVFTVKHNADGSIDRYKARLVARGFTQTYGVDYLDTFSPVARHSTLRILLSVAVAKDWPLYQLDVKNAFLYGDLQEEVYMQQPPGFAVEGECSKVCRLHKAIYGLKQSPRAWFQKLSDLFEKQGYKRSNADHSLFVQKTARGTIVIMVYVDDILITGDDDRGIKQAKERLGTEFVTKDLGVLRYFLGLEFARNPYGLVMTQRKYVTDLLSETGMLGCRPATTPMDPSMKLYDDGTEEVDQRRYRELVGKLLYVTITRPDIQFAVSRVSQFMEQPRQVHMDAIHMILRYLKSSPGAGLLFKKGKEISVTGCADADYAGCPKDRKSTSGFAVYVGDALVSWKSKKQTVVARSSAESEYRAMAQASTEMMWVKSLLADLFIDIPTPMRLECDNQAALFITNNPAFHERTKHIEVDCHYIRDMIQKGFIATSHVSSENQTADIFTKALSKGPFQKCASKLSMIDIYAPS